MSINARWIVCAAVRTRSSTPAVPPRRGDKPERQTAPEGVPGDDLAYWRRAGFSFRLGGRRGHSRQDKPTPNHLRPARNVTSSHPASHRHRGQTLPDPSRLVREPRRSRSSGVLPRIGSCLTPWSTDFSVAAETTSRYLRPGLSTRRTGARDGRRVFLTNRCVERAEGSIPNRLSLRPGGCRHRQ